MKKKVIPLNLSPWEAKKYFMEARNYFTVALPPYFDVAGMLQEMDMLLEWRGFRNCLNPNVRMRDLAGVNFDICVSKDGGYGWRNFKMIHPLVYVEIVRILTEAENWAKMRERFRLYASQKTVVCTSLAPGAETKRSATAASILKWWHGIEQTSVKMALYYNYMVETDIMECYASISSDLVRKALPCEVGEPLAQMITDFSEGRTVGLPQGSILFDFVAEAVFGYLDVAYHNEVKRRKIKGEYTVVRYRDDYRIFAKDEVQAKKLLKALSDVLMRFGLKLNPAKTAIHDDILMVARKADKRYWEDAQSMVTMGKDRWLEEPNILKQLFAIYELAEKFPNSGSVQKALTELYFERVLALKHRPDDSYQLLALMVNIMAKNPRTIQVGVAICSKILSFNPGISRKCLADLTLEKMKMLPSSDYAEICLQRLTAKVRPGKKYKNKLSQLLYDVKVQVWNSEWMGFRFMDMDLLNRKMIREMDFVVPMEEVSVFDDYNGEEMGEFREFEGV